MTNPNLVTVLERKIRVLEKLGSTTKAANARVMNGIDNTGMDGLEERFEPDQRAESHEKEVVHQSAWQPVGKATDRTTEEQN